MCELYSYSGALLGVVAFMLLSNNHPLLISGTNDLLKDQRVLLLESGKPPTFKKKPEDFSNRVSAIAPASKRLFQSIIFFKKMKL